MYSLCYDYGGSASVKDMAILKTAMCAAAAAAEPSATDTVVTVAFAK